MKKIISFTQLKSIRQTVGDKRRVVLMSGVFDLFHYGHFKALEKASRMGDLLIVQIDGNQLVKKRKSTNRPYLDEGVRARMIAAFEFVDYVFISNAPSESKRTLKGMAPHVYIRALLPEQTPLTRTLREKKLNALVPKMKVVWLPQTAEISTTKIISVVGKTRTEFTRLYHFH